MESGLKLGIVEAAKKIFACRWCIGWGKAIYGLKID